MGGGLVVNTVLAPLSTPVAVPGSLPNGSFDGILVSAMEPRTLWQSARASTAEPVPGDVSALLRAWSDGDQLALALLMPIVHDELRRLAHHYMRRERAGHGRQTTALVNEAYPRLLVAATLRTRSRRRSAGRSDSPSA